MVATRDEKRLVWFIILLIIIVGGGELALPQDKDNIDAARLFPLTPGNWWEFEGTDLRSNRSFRTLVTVGQRKEICGITVTPLFFFKDQRFGYWGPDDDLNLEWLLVDFDARGSKYPDFLWALGDRRYRRDLNEFEGLGTPKNFTAYVSAAILEDLPPYIIFQRPLQCGKIVRSAQEYYQTSEDRFDCDRISRSRRIGSADWRLTYDIVSVRTPAFDGEAVRVNFVENFGEQAWKEDWFFAKDVGPIKIETFSQGQKLADNMPVMHRLELKSYFAKTRNGQIKKRD